MLFWSQSIRRSKETSDRECVFSSVFILFKKYIVYLLLQDDKFHNEFGIIFILNCVLLFFLFILISKKKLWIAQLKSKLVQLSEVLRNCAILVNATNLQFAVWQRTRVGDNNLFFWSVPWICWLFFNVTDNVHTFKDLTKNNMSTVQPWCQHGGNEELWSICVFTSICHTQKTDNVVLQCEVFISKTGTVNRFSMNDSIISEEKKWFKFQRKIRFSCKKWIISITTYPPVPSPAVKSPPWIMKSLMTRWNLLPL